MRLRLQFFFSACLLALSFFIFTGCANVISPPPLPPTAQGMKNATERAYWRMAWVGDFGARELPHKDLEPHFKTYIRSVKIETSVIEDEVFTMSAFAGCNHIGREVRQRIVTPARTIEKTRDTQGQVKYEVIPAVLEPYVESVTTQKSCYENHEIEGKKYVLDWINPMEEFILTHFQSGRNLRKGDTLEWVNSEGIVLARFEIAL